MPKEQTPWGASACWSRLLWQTWQKDCHPCQQTEVGLGLVQSLHANFKQPFSGFMRGKEPMDLQTAWWVMNSLLTPVKNMWRLGLQSHLRPAGIRMICWGDMWIPSWTLCSWQDLDFCQNQKSRVHELQPDECWMLFCEWQQMSRSQRGCH